MYENLEKADSLDYRKELEQKWMNLIFIHKGRMNSLDFFFLNFCLKGAQKIFEYDTGVTILNWLLIAMGIFFAYISISSIAKRFRDIGLSGWFALPYTLTYMVAGVLIYLVPEYSLTGVIILFAIGFTLVLWPSQKQENKYGPYDRAGLFRTPMKK